MGRWRYTGFLCYGCPERYRRQESWNLITELARMSQLSWCILGNFNDMMYEHEKQGGRPHLASLLEDFREAVNACELVDLGFTGNEFTWESLGVLCCGFRSALTGAP